MYYPILNTMSRFQINDFLTTRLDVWLGTRRKSTRNYLNPLQFSVDTGVDTDTALSLFAICTQNEIKILKEKYVIECYCSRVLGVYSSPSDIPPTILCVECNQNIIIKKDMITIWFELLKDPQEQLYSRFAKQLTTGDSLGKAESLRPKLIEESNHPMVRRLFSNYNERLRSIQ